MKKKVVHFFHGFLGLPDDWSFCAIPGAELQAWSFWNWLERDEVRNWDHLTAIFRSHLQEFSDCDNYLVAYSMGGRLLLQFLEEEPTFFKKVVMVSVNPGLRDTVKKIERRENDNQWAERFLTWSWDSLLREWNNQAVFDQNSARTFNEQNYSREALAKVLRHFSLGYQKDYRPLLKDFPRPMLWMVGECDTRFVKIAEELQEEEFPLKFMFVENCYHRVPWEGPELFQKLIMRFLNDE